VVTVLAILGAVGFFMGLSKGASFGSTTFQSGQVQQDAFLFLNGFSAGSSQQFAVNGSGQVNFGANGSTLTNFIFGKCNVTQTTPGSQAATTTAQFYCAVPGVNAGDYIIGDMPANAGNYPNGSLSPQGGFDLISTYATSSGIVAFQIANFTGGASSSFAQATTSVEYFDYR